MSSIGFSDVSLNVSLVSVILSHKVAEVEDDLSVDNHYLL